jgi:hypothetical protein
MKYFVSENIFGETNTSALQVVGWWQGDNLHLTRMISANYINMGADVVKAGSVIDDGPIEEKIE